MTERKWDTEPGCWRASLKVDFPPGANFVYRAWNNMGGRDGAPCITGLSGHNGEMPSDDVIVIGDSDNKRYLLVGALTAFRSQSFFRVVRRGGRFTAIEAEQPEILPGAPPEELFVLEGSDWRDMLFRYANETARKMGVKKIHSEKNVTGYCTWYYYYKEVTGQNLLDNVKVLAENRSVYAAEYVQIDDGYQRRHGDWLDRCDTWPFSLKEAAKRIIDGGMKPGIWLMPFVASTASRLYQEHPDWMVKDPSTGKPVLRSGWTAPPERDWCCLDTSIPEVNEHIVSIFRKMREMGYVYFKLDGLGYGLTGGLRHDPNMTVISAFRKLIRAIRDAVPDALLIACSEPFMPCLGLFDHARVSCDTSRYFSSPESPDSNYPGKACDILHAQRLTMMNFWKFDRWFRCDPDVLMARQDNAFYTEGESRFSVLTGLLTGISITSDRLDTIAPERLALLGVAQKYRMLKVRPFRWKCGQWPHFFEGIVNGRRAVAVFNDSENELKCNFAELGLPEKCLEILTGEKYTGVRMLPRHDAALLLQEQQ